MINGRTPLHYASMGGHYSIVYYLLSKGANPNHYDHFSKKPIDYSQENGHDKITNLLEETNGCRI